MKKVKFGGYQHRYWLSQQDASLQHQERLISELLEQLKNLETGIAGRPLSLLAQLQSSMAHSRQIVREMNDRLGEPSQSRLDEIIEKINCLERTIEEAVMKTS